MLSRGSLVLVTGAAGFIGAHVVRRLRAEGYRVRALDDLSRGRRERLGGAPAGSAGGGAGAAGRGPVEDVDAELVVDDVRSERAVRAACEGVAGVIHLAAPPPAARGGREERHAHDVTVTGTLNLLAAARDAGVRRFVFASSGAVYGGGAKFLLHEDLAPAPTTAEGAQKLAAEAYVKLFAARDGMGACALRFFAVYGPGQDDGEDAPLLARFVHAAAAGAPAVIPGDGRETRDLLHVDDAAAAIVAALGTPGLSARVLNVASGEPVAVRHVLALLGELAGGLPAPRYVPAPLGEPHDVRVSVSAAATHLGFRARVRLRDGLARWLAELRRTAAPPPPSPEGRSATARSPVVAAPVPMAPLPQRPAASGRFERPVAQPLPSTPLFGDRPPSWLQPEEETTLTSADVVAQEVDDGWTG